MAEIIELSRDSNPVVQLLLKRVNEVLRRQYDWDSRRKKIERQIWTLEQGLPLAIVEYGNERPATKDEARAILRRDLYQAVAELMRLRCLRAHLKYALRMARSGDAYKISEILRDVDEMSASA